MCNRRVEYLFAPGRERALHSWIPEHPKAVVFYFHGMQSHAGWSFEVGPQLADSGVALFILEREGIGLSKGIRGDISSLEGLLTDYYDALQLVKERYPKLPLTLFGQSFGGSVLAGLLCWNKFAVDYEQVVFCTSALGKRHSSLAPKHYAAQLLDRSRQLLPLNFANTDMTELPQYLHFIAEERYPCREITHRARAVMLELESLYWNKRGIINDRAAVFIHPKVDPLVNITQAVAIFQQLCSGKGTTLQFATTKHYLWFTKERHALIRWLVNFATKQNLAANSSLIKQQGEI